MKSQDKSKLADALADLLSNKNTFNRDFHALDTLKYREDYLRDNPGETIAAPQPNDTPDEFKRLFPLYPQVPMIFKPDLMLHQFDFKKLIEDIENTGKEKPKLKEMKLERTPLKLEEQD